MDSTFLPDSKAKQKSKNKLAKNSIDVKIAICNELFHENGFSFDEFCETVSEMGYSGIELAPYTFFPKPDSDITNAKDENEYFKKIIGFLSNKEEAARIKSVANKCGLQIVALHWLLKSPFELSISSSNPRIVRRTVEFFKNIVIFSNNLDCNILVLGSPQQRNIVDENGKMIDVNLKDLSNVIKTLKKICDIALEINGEIFIGFEPLSKNVTNVGRNIREALEIISKVGKSNFGLHIDTNAIFSELDFENLNQSNINQNVDKVFSEIDAYINSNNSPEHINSELDSKSFFKSISKSLSESISESLSESISKSLSESISKSLSESISKSLSESLSESLSMSSFNDLIKHVHLNEPNRLGPGMITRKVYTNDSHINSPLNRETISIVKDTLINLIKRRYSGYVSVEAFDADYDPLIIAEESIKNIESIIKSIKKAEIL